MNKIVNYFVVLLFVMLCIFCAPRSQNSISDIENFEAKEASDDNDLRLENGNIVISKRNDKNQFVYLEKNPLGVIVSETLEISDDPPTSITTIYSNKGNFLVRYKEVEEEPGTLGKISILAPAERPSNIPEDAGFDTKLLKWTQGRRQSGKKEGKWLLWWPDGHKAGWIEFQSGKVTGNARFIMNHKYNEFLPYVHDRAHTTYKVFYDIIYKKWDWGDSLICRPGPIKPFPVCKRE